MLFLLSFFMFYFSYLFSILFLGFLVMVVMLVYFSNFMFLKYLVVLVYVSGVVVFILYITCMCWLSSQGFMKGILVFGFFCVYIYDIGAFSKFGDVGESLWMYLFFGFLFNNLVMSYSLNLFKVSGSLRL